jgi:hypothetical protein
VVDEWVDTGEHAVRLYTGTLPVGTYFYRLILDGALVETKEMVIQR